MANQRGMVLAWKIILVFILVVFLVVAGGLSWAVYKMWPILKASKYTTPAAETTTETPGSESAAPDNSNSSNPTASDKNPLLSSDQERVLENLGVNVDALPKTITPALEQCFIEKLGPDRVNEIKGGSSMSAMDFFQVNGCF